MHLALSEQTRGLVDAALLSKLRPGRGLGISEIDFGFRVIRYNP